MSAALPTRSSPHHPSADFIAINPVQSSAGDRPWATQLNNVLELNKAVVSQLHNHAVLLLDAQEKTHLAVAVQIEKLIEENRVLKQEREAILGDKARLVGDKLRLLEKNAALEQEIVVLGNAVDEATATTRAVRVDMDALKTRVASLLSSDSDPITAPSSQARVFQNVEQARSGPSLEAPSHSTSGTIASPSGILAFQARIRPSTLSTILFDAPAITPIIPDMIFNAPGAPVMIVTGPSDVPSIPTSPIAEPTLPVRFPSVTIAGERDRERVAALRQRLREYRRRARAEEVTQRRGGPFSSGFVRRRVSESDLEEVVAQDGEASEVGDEFELVYFDVEVEEGDVYLVDV